MPRVRGQTPSEVRARPSSGPPLAPLARWALPLLACGLSCAGCGPLLIAGGEGMLQDGYVLGGHAVLWSGCAALLVLLALAWHKMSRN